METIIPLIINAFGKPKAAYYLKKSSKTGKVIRFFFEKPRNALGFGIQYEGYTFIGDLPTKVVKLKIRGIMSLASLGSDKEFREKLAELEKQLAEHGWKLEDELS